MLRRGQHERSRFFVFHFRVVIRFSWWCFLVLFFFLFASTSLAEELEPRLWAHLPINTNFIGSGYAYTEADIDFDPVLKIDNGQMEMHTWAARYIRSFALFDKTARFGLLQAYQDGHWTGILDGTAKTVNRSGWTDTILRFAINLYGSPPLKGEEYMTYRAAKGVDTTAGVGLSVQLPTGNYMDDKLINLGTNRFTLRPQFGISHKTGKWFMEATGLVALYTDNNEFFNGSTLEQDPLYVIHGHLIYTFRPGLWASASAGYDYGGRSTVDGAKKDDLKQDLAWAFGFGFPLNRQWSVKAAYIRTRTQESTGVDSDTFTIVISTFW
jgi:hypothetical protein